MKIDPGKAPPPLRGFRFAGIHGGIKKKGRRDIALIVADRPCACAAAFTQNTAAAAPVRIARAHAADGKAQAVLINSGNANAATGEQGLTVARWSCGELAGRLSIDPSMVLPCSTGVIGVPLVKRTMACAIAAAVDALSVKGFGAAARAIMTSDAFPKWATRTVDTGHGTVTVSAMAKGAGMIEPNMATLLSVVLTDAPLSSGAADTILRAALEQSYNRISIDGDTSTNDTAILLANGDAAGPEITTPDSPGYDVVAGAVTEVMQELSRMMVRDGEGASKLIDITVEGAADSQEAELGARTIANSTLMKCALTGADPNWGRILMALGNTTVSFNPDTVEIFVDDLQLVRAGALVSSDAAASARRIMRGDEYRILVRIGSGEGTATIVTSDLTEAYVHFNSAYTS